MALTAKVDTTVTPVTLTVVSDRRKVSVSVTSAGETATGTAAYPVVVSDTSGKVWTVQTDDAVTAVYV